MDEHIFSIAEISSILKECFDNPMFSNISIYGEIYSIKRGKFSYIELGDKDHKEINSPIIKCAFSPFCKDNIILKDLKIGDIIKVKGKLSYYPHGSSITFWGEKVQLLLNDMGKSLLEKRKILERLDRDGILTRKRKQLPKICSRVSILTALDSAAYHDIINTLHKRFPVDTVLYPITAQGENAAKSIVQALKRADQSECDCIILGRGGGSKSDLNCFDDEEVARAISSCIKPVITCIGHTIDISIADRVSDIKAITPTEGASLINPSLDEVYRDIEILDNDLDNSYNEIYSSLIYSLNIDKERLEKHSPLLKLNNEIKENERIDRYIDQLIMNRFSDVREDIDLKDKNLDQVIFNRLKEERNTLDRYRLTLDKYSIDSILDRGFSLVYYGESLISNIDQISQGDIVSIKMKEGRIKAEVKEKEYE